MFESQIGDLDDERVGSQAIGLDNDRPAIFFRGIEQRSELFEDNFLIAKINRRRRTARDADNLRINLGTKREPG